jgi:dTDP-glucose 4,6-dehydratase
LGEKKQKLMAKKILVTGGAGFIGSNFIRYWLDKYPDDQIVNFDALTYAGHLDSLKDLADDPTYSFIQGDITDAAAVDKAMNGVDLVVHFAAESHVDRSVIDPLVFVRTNVLGTATLLNAAVEHKLKHFHHVSTDEVYGDLQVGDPPFEPEQKYNPRSPYAASKAGADHLVRAFHKTFGLPVTITNCANNYGPYHDPEKIIPRFITNLLEGQKVPLMGEGAQIREWLYVTDHASAIDIVIHQGEVGQTYLVQGEERTNLEVTRQLLKLLDQDESMIEYVEERLGHDFRYACNGTKLKALGWSAEYDFNDWLAKTVEWYKDNEWWWKPLKEGRPNVDRTAQKDYDRK